MTGGLALSPALRAALAQWLAQMRALKGASANTVAAYGADVSRYLDFLAQHRGGAEGLRAVVETGQSDLRASGWPQSAGAGSRRGRWRGPCRR